MFQAIGLVISLALLLAHLVQADGARFSHPNNLSTCCSKLFNPILNFRIHCGITAAALIFIEVYTSIKYSLNTFRNGNR